MALKQQVSNVYGVGLRNAGSYVVSGQPFVTRRSVNVGEEVKIEFPYVTKNVTIRIPSPPNNAALIKNSNGQWLSNTYNLYWSPQLPLMGGASHGDVTMSFWFRFMGNYGGTGAFIAMFFYPNAGWGNGLSIGLIPAAVAPNGNRGIRMFGTQGSIGTMDNNSFWADDQKWHQLVFTQSGSTTALYIDGIGGTGSAGGAALVQGTGVEGGAISAMRLGWNGGGGWEHTEFDEATIWNTGFSQADVTEFYNSGEFYNPNSSPKKANLVSWFTMGDTLGDISLPQGPQDPGSVGPGPGFGFFSSSVENPAVANQNLQMFYTEEVNLDIVSGTIGPFTSQTTGKLRVHTLSTGSSPHGANIVANKHYQELQGYNTSISLPMKTKEIYLTGVGAQVTFEVIAELTNIPTNRMYALTGPGIDD